MKLFINSQKSIKKLRFDETQMWYTKFIKAKLQTPLKSEPPKIWVSMVFLLSSYLWGFASFKIVDFICTVKPKRLKINKSNAIWTPFV